MLTGEENKGLEVSDRVSLWSGTSQNFCGKVTVSGRLAMLCLVSGKRSETGS